RRLLLGLGKEHFRAPEDAHGDRERFVRSLKRAKENLVRIDPQPDPFQHLIAVLDQSPALADLGLDTVSRHALVHLRGSVVEDTTNLGEDPIRDVDLEEGYFAPIRGIKLRDRGMALQAPIRPDTDRTLQSDADRAVIAASTHPRTEGRNL